MKAADTTPAGWIFPEVRRYSAAPKSNILDNMIKEPAVSVVIATRDRPTSLGRLLRCVKMQDFAGFECIVVDDASTEETVGAYAAIWRELDERFRLLLPEPGARQVGGPSRARNRGIMAAQGEFIAFCDDDDLWVREDHLRVAVQNLRQHGGDLFFGNLQTSRAGTIIGPDFYGTVRDALTRNPLPGADDLFEVVRSDRARSMQHMFLHCDSLVVSRALLLDCGMYWEKLSMAEDRDLGLRLLDRAQKVLYRSTVVADYDRTAVAGICKSYTEDEIRQFIVLAMMHAESRMEDPALRRVARGYRAWMLVELAQGAAEAGRSEQARELAMQSLLVRPTAEALRLFTRMSFGPRPRAALHLGDRTQAN
jgi:glycosyltransferase involved in cell wall biosynthesis